MKTRITTDVDTALLNKDIFVEEMKEFLDFK